MDGECVHASRELAGKRAVDHAMALDPALSNESSRHDMDAEMGLAATSMAGMPGVQMGFIEHFQARRLESLGQLSCDDIADAHAPPDWRDFGAKPEKYIIALVKT